jgi:FkbM family methyltransferase
MIGLIGRLATRFKPAIFKGQKGQDRWVIQEVLPWKRRGFFLDLAAADGVTHSNTLVLEKWFGWRGICIEPNPAFFAELKARRRCAVEPSVVSDRRERIRFRVDNGQLGGVVADDTDNNERVRGDQLARAEIIELEAMPLNEILERHNAPRTIDYFSLDVEGCEERIISSLDFRRYEFRCLTVERPTPRVNEVLFDNGYVFVKNFSFDSFYVHPSVLDGRPLRCEPFEQVPPKDW